MKTLTILDPTIDDTLGQVRGGGRVVKILQENLKDNVRFVASQQQVAETDTLLVPVWQPFKPPAVTKRIARTQILMLFDVIPIKYPEYFPAGLKGRWRLLQNLQSLRHYDAILTISKAARNDIIEYLNMDPGAVKVVYLTTSSAFFKPSGVIPAKSALMKKFNLPDKDYCVYVGDANWNKNVANLAQAVIKARAQCVCIGRTFSIIPELRRMDREAQQDFLASDGAINHPEQADFKTFVKLVLHDSSFHFPGFVQDSELLGLYKNAACNLLVSRDEGFGLTFLEAATQKCPSVLADIDVFREISDDAALFADPESPADIASKIKELLNDPKKRSALGRKAYQRSRAFSPDVFVKNLLGSVEEVDAR